MLFENSLGVVPKLCVIARVGRIHSSPVHNVAKKYYLGQVNLEPMRSAVSLFVVRNM